MPSKSQPSVTERTARRIALLQQTLPQKIARYLGPSPTMESATS